MARRRELASIAALLIALAGTIGALHRLGDLTFLSVDWRNLDRWLAVTAPEDALAALVRVGALAFAYWVAISTVSYLLARASRVPAAVRVLRWTTLPPIRRLADRAVAVSLAVSTMTSTGIAGAAEVGGLPPDPPASQVVVGVDEHGIVSPPGVLRLESGSGDSQTFEYVPRPTQESKALTPSPGRPSPGAASPAEEAADGEADDETTNRRPRQQPADSSVAHVVEKGDNLWDLARRRLAGVLDRDDLTDVEIAPYWAKVIEANRDSIRSGDPDLIYPGETIELPPVEGA